MSEYFNKFPLINYNSESAINLFARVTVREDLKLSPTVYLPLIIEEGERADMVAYDYYDNSTYSWLIYLANDIIDPYYDYPMTQGDFEAYLKKKYGSLETALNTTVFYQLREDPGVIINAESLADQDNAADWWPVTAYNYEMYLNDLRASRYIIRKDLAPAVNSELEKLLKDK